MTDIETTWDIARAGFEWPDFARLMKDGIASGTLAEAMADIAIGADDIAVKNGRWERRFRGDRAIIMPTFTPSGAMTDLVAFRMDTPRSFWLLTGAGMMLGHESLDRADYYREPLMVHESPLEWLKAGRQGVVILDWQRYWPAYLGGVSALQFEDRTFGRRAEALLQKPLVLPPFLVPAA